MMNVPRDYARRTRNSGRWLMLVAFLLPALNVFAEEEPLAKEAVTSKGLLPIPNYVDDILNRSHLAGDLWGTRTSLAEKGLQLDVDWTQYAQSIVTGGRDTGSQYGA